MRKRKKLVDRLLSMVLALLLAFNILPATAYAANTPEAPSNSEPTNYTITVKEPADESGVQSAVEGATVKYTIKVDETTREEKNVTTDENGIAILDDMADTEVSTALTDGKKVTLTYEVSKEGYNTVVSDTDVEITSVTGNLDVQLSKKEQSTITATISDSDNKESAVVKVNESDITLTDGKGSISVDKGSKVTISVAPVNEEGKNNVYIKSLSIAGVEKTIDENNKYGYSEEIDVNDDLDIKVELGTQYTITVNGLDSTKGTVSLAGAKIEEGNNTKIVEAGTSASLSVIPNEKDNYQIKDIKINNEVQNITSRVSFQIDNFIVNEDTVINVEFEKLYTITATVVGDKNGNITINDNTCDAGEVKISEDNNGFTLVATPNENYRVAKVTRNDELIVPKKNGDETANKCIFTDKIDKVDKNYKYEITFALNQFSVDAESDANGNVTVEELNANGKVDYGSDAKLAIAPKRGYKIKSVKYSLGNGIYQEINITEMSEYDKKLFEYEEYNKGSYLIIKNVLYNYEFKVEFEKVKADSTVLEKIMPTENLSTYYEENNTIYYIYKTTQINLKVSGVKYNQFSMFDKESEEKNYEWKDNCDVTKDCEITNLYAREKDSNNIVDVLNGKVLKIFVQQNNDVSPEVSIEMPEKQENCTQYNKSVDVGLKVARISKVGICKLEYAIITPDDKGNYVVANRDFKTLYTANENSKGLVKDDIAEDKIPVDCDKYNCDNIKIIARMTDWLGYTNESKEIFSINKDIPKVEISFNDSDNTNDGAKSGYFKNRTATITVTDRASSFNKDSIDSGIKNGISAVDAKKNKVDISTDINNWKNVDWKYDNGKFTKTIEFTTDANYVWSIDYTNNAGSNVTSSEKKFTVDNIKPEGSVIIEETIFDKLLENLTFGGFKNSEINVSADSSDSISGTDIYYYKDNQDKMLTWDELDNKEFKEVTDKNKVVSINPDEQAVVYIKIVDYAGNYSYVSSKGYIADSKKSEITIEPQNYFEKSGDGDNATYIYNKQNQNKDGKFVLNVKVTEPKAADDESYAGINSVSYRILADGNETVNKTLYSFNNDDPTKADLKNEWSGNIVVDSKANNSSNVVVEVTTKDNAGNSNTKDIKLDIDVTNPDISVSY
ncbi:hypothetical protein, partial [Agathobacter sp.]